MLPPYQAQQLLLRVLAETHPLRVALYGRSRGKTVGSSTPPPKRPELKVWLDEPVGHPVLPLGETPPAAPVPLALAVHRALQPPSGAN